MDNPVADELAQALQAHRENRLKPPPDPPVWTDTPNDVQWAGDEGDSKEVSDSP